MVQSRPGPAEIALLFLVYMDVDVIGRIVKYAARLGVALALSAGARAAGDEGRAKVLAREIVSLEKGGQWEQCLAALEEYKGLVGAADGNIYTHIGCCYYMLGDMAHAEEYYEKSVFAAPGLWWAPFYLGAIASSRGDYERAVRCFAYAACARDLVAPRFIFLTKFNLLAARIEWYKARTRTDARAADEAHRRELLAALDDLETFIVTHADACEIEFTSAAGLSYTNGALCLTQIYQYRRELDGGLASLRENPLP